MTEYIIEIPDSKEVDEFIARIGIEDCRVYGCRLTGEIVRCRDCKRWESGDCDWNPYYDDPVDDQPDGYCAWSRRKNEE